MNSETVGDAAFAEFSQEDYLLAGFLYGYVVVLNALVLVFKVVELVVVGGEEAFCAASSLVQIFHQGAGY